MNNELLVKSIRDLCKKNKIAISQLENDLNFGSGLISRWAKSSPSIDRIIDIANYFHVSVDEVIGYNQNNNDEFLNKLYEQTNTGILVWHSANIAKKTYPKLKIYTRINDPMSGMYDIEEYNEETYVTQYKNGYFMLYAFYKYGKILDPDELYLVIQPSDDSNFNFQAYKKEELLKLWIKVLNRLGDETPDEIKAEDFKNSFLNDTNPITTNNLSDKQLLQITNELIEKTEFKTVFEIINNSVFKTLSDALDVPDFQSIIKTAQKLNQYYLMLKDKNIKYNSKENKITDKESD